MELLDQLTTTIFPYAVGWFVILTGVRTAVVLRRGYSIGFSPAKGSPRRGILYSLTFSMLPWKKDSTRRHPWTYAAGMGMHLGLFLTIVFALGRRFWAWPDWIVLIFGVIASIGFVSAMGLFIKRNVKPYMRPISNPDDYISNFIVQLYLLGGGLTAFFPEFVGLWRLGAILLLFYVPLGKIYHMFLFFVSRILFGLQFGRRGVLKHDAPISF
ncbi:MAG: hypothetical protein GY805_00520 [Chloroflexi bacterium]|nr:hypothetical protein [Chloroflexota bacterium]